MATRLRRLVAALGGAVALLPALAVPAGSQAAGAPGPAAPTVRRSVPKVAAGPVADADSVLVRFRQRGRAVDGRLAALGARVVRDVGVDGWALVATGTGRAPAVRRSLAADPTVARTEPNLRRKASWTPTDPTWGTQSQYLSGLRLERAWDRTRGAGVTVAVLDTGVDLDHPDLAGRLLPGASFVAGSGVQDDHGHGTAVSGVIAAAANNGRGIAGVAAEASILPVKVLDGDAGGSDADIASGIVWAADHGAEVINMSLGGEGSSSVLASAVAYAIGKDVVVVAAAGNEGTDTNLDGDPLVNYPAAYDGVVAVAATGHSGENVTYFSTHGWWVDVAAPGITISATKLGASEAYDVMDGTSFSSPIVAGGAALVRAADPAATQATVTGRIVAGARDRGPHGFDTRFGHGVVDALAALGGAAPAARPDVAGEAAEPNDEPSRATTLAAPATGSINPEGDEDWFGLDLTGGTYTLTVQPPPPDSMDDPRGLDAIIELFGPDLAPLAAADWTGLDDTETLTFSVAGAGHYLARVRNWSGTVSPGAYGITLEGGASGDGSLGPPTALSLSDTVPADRALAVAASTSPSLVFARPVNPATVSGATVRLLDGRTLAPVAATVTLDGAATTATVDPTGSLAAGPYLVQVDGVADSLGSPMAATAVRFTVGTPDLAPPGTVITAAPASTTAVQAAGFSFGSPDGGTAFECRVDSQDWWACSSAASVVVSPGPHTFDVMARDAAGNEDPSPASASWTFAPPATAAPARTSVQQYTLANSDGTTWVPIDAANPANVTTQFPATTTGKALVTANVDLWTFTAGFNQDLAIFSSVDGGPFALVAWKESGGFAGTFSPNAAAVQALVPVTAGSTYQFQLRWKTNKGGTSTIAAGAGPVSGSFSPTSIVVRQAPDAAAATAGVSTQQYTLTNSNGTTWVPVDAAALTTRVTPASAGTATVTANADLWTWDAGFNQDLAIFMSVDSGAYGLVAWKESGGFAGTFSPNAASVQAQVPVGAGSTYDFQLRWKANKPGTSRISAGAGPIAGAFSPTSIVAVVNPTATAASYSATSTAQYTMENGNGSAWLPVDAAALTVDLPAPGTACSALVTANADLWTWTAGFNQDIALFARQADGPWSMVAWKESGGFAGTFSPNAAAVQAVVPMAAGSTYQVQLRWKANKSGASKISAGAGPIDGDFSPTSVVARTSGC